MAMMTMDALNDFDKLNFYRNELKHEFSLLAMRTTILVTCQSFLVVPYAILNTAPKFASILVSIYLVAGLGVFVALLLVGPLRVGRRMIAQWLIKQRGLLQSSTTLQDLAIDRDRIPGSDQRINEDKEHTKSLAFSIYAPWAFCSFWVLAVVWSTIRYAGQF
jgi:hypothetical protein